MKTLGDALRKAVGVEIKFELTHGSNSHLLERGTIRRMFTVIGPVHQLNMHAQNCVHSWMTQAGEVRVCTSQADAGFLCGFHYDYLHKKFAPQRDRDDEAVEKIILDDWREIGRSHLVVKKWGKRQITILLNPDGTEVRKKLDAFGIRLYYSEVPPYWPENLI